ncbi:MAG TPA: ABC-F family ATP-binding cassette domain-containing protein [Acidimicrobiales bacterium]|nr:ABC-F family ATP-binding cassette domain-containing protein [Acidimicrobiales bacterium]
MPILIDLQKVKLQGADRSLLDNLDLTVSTGDRIGVVGINGVGKTTLLKIIAGTLKPDSGDIRRGRGIHVGFLEQIPSLPVGTVRDTLGSGWQVDAALDRLGMLSSADADTTQLSGGQLKRVALARVFAEPNDVLILDEPTNHLDLSAIQWLEQQIMNFRGAVILVSHDRFLLDQVTTRMVEIDRGKTYVHAGGYSRLLETQAEREEQAASAEQVRRNLAKTELAWLRRGVKARSTKPQARIDAAKRLLASRPDAAAREGTLDLSVVTPRLGTMVLKAHHVAFTYDGEHQVLRDVDLDLGPGDRVGVVGPNGSGKSTFVNLLAQRVEPTSGTVKRGPTVVTAYLDQEGGEFDLEKTVQELVAGPQGVPGSLDDVALMKRFWFTGALPTTKAKDLSGGERRRLQLLLALSVHPNVLFLDEPTNDLDLETIRLIEEFLSQWPGTLIVVSHDRTFLSRTTDRLLEVHTDGTIADVPGGIDAWIARASGVTVSSPSSDEDDAHTGASPSSDVPTGRQIRDAEKEMARLERRRKTITEKILATDDHTEQTRLGIELAVVQKSLDLAEEYWLTLVD